MCVCVSMCACMHVFVCVRAHMCVCVRAFMHKCLQLLEKAYPFMLKTLQHHTHNMSKQSVVLFSFIKRSIIMPITDSSLQNYFLRSVWYK